jgi:hypothetical protein
MIILIISSIISTSPLVVLKSFFSFRPLSYFQVGSTFRGHFLFTLLELVYQLQDQYPKEFLTMKQSITR